MSVPVTPDELFDELELWGAGVLITVGDDGSARVVTLHPEAIETDTGAMMRFVHPGRTALANVGRTERVTVFFPAHPDSDGYSLIVDGDARLSADGQAIEMSPTSAVRHRPPPVPDQGSDS